MNMLRVWPIVCQFGVGAVLCLVGIWAGSGRISQPEIRRDRRLVATRLAGYLLLLVLAGIFTFLSPHWAEGGPV